ncbi:flavodoxin domain-containing protein [Candidatus Bathyarchaeota archaeon]|nr:flavodoxin domain-containing protein [Candidatus Bathyarchaeota archaeon]
MPTVVVIYDSKTGFTESMAKAVVNGVRDVKGVEGELLKVGTPFSVSRLDKVDAIVLGSPSYYGDVTHEMKAFLETLKDHKETNKLELSGKKGGIFAAYTWDKGWVIDKLQVYMNILGIELVAPPVSALDRMGGSIFHGGKVPLLRIDENSLQKCSELGQVVASNLRG